MRASALPPPPAVAGEAALGAYGELLGAALVAPVVITLRGELGAGKTTLVQAIVRGAGVTGNVTSPTFALVHEYGTPQRRVFHLDLYRLRDASELANIGWDDIMTSDAIVLVEWPERAGSQLPLPRLDIMLRDAPGVADARVVEAVWME